MPKSTLVGSALSEFRYFLFELKVPVVMLMSVFNVDWEFCQTEISSSPQKWSEAAHQGLDFYRKLRSNLLYIPNDKGVLHRRNIQDAVLSKLIDLAEVPTHFRRVFSLLPPEHTGYYRLLQDIFGTKSVDEVIRAEVEAVVEDPKTTDETFIELVETRLYSKLSAGEFAMSPLTEADIEEFDRLIGNLKPREQIGLRLKYALGGGEPMSYGELGRNKRFNEGMPKEKVTAQRARDVVTMAHRRMRHHSRSSYLRTFLSSIDRINNLQTDLEQTRTDLAKLKDEFAKTIHQLNGVPLVLQLKTEISKLRKQAPVHFKDRDLNRSIDEFEMSARTFNALRGAGIRTLRDLVFHTEKELQETMHFGKKTMREVVDQILTPQGLRLGMEFDDEGKLIRDVASSSD